MALTKVKAGNILLTTPGASSNDVTPATTAYVTTALANLADSAPSTLDTLNELAAALGDDANFSTTVTNSIAAKLPLAGGTLTGALVTSDLITANTARIIIQRSNDDSSIAFSNNASGTPSSHTWAAGLNYSNSNQFSIAYASNGLASLEASKMVITTDGKVGIGTASPAQNLHVEGAGNQFILLNNSSTNDGFYFKAGSGASSIQTNAGSHLMNFFTGGNERFRIDSTGAFGIGGGNYGSDGQILTSTGGSSAPAWEDAPASGPSKGLAIVLGMIF